MANPNSKFYFIRQDTSEAFELSATTDITITSELIATERNVETGKEITDNSYLKNQVVTFSGIITNVRNTTNLLDVDTFLDQLQSLRKSSPRVLVDVFADNRVVTNCLITSLSTSKSPVIGLGAWQVNLTMKEVTFSERARLVEIPEAKIEQKDLVDPTSQRSQNTTKEVPIATTSTISVYRGLSGQPEVSVPENNNATSN